MPSVLELLPPDQRPDLNTLRPAARELLLSEAPEKVWSKPANRAYIAGMIAKRLPTWTLMTTSAHANPPEPISKSPALVRGFAGGVAGAVESGGRTLETAGVAMDPSTAPPGAGAGFPTLPQTLKVAGRALRRNAEPASRFYRPDHGILDPGLTAGQRAGAAAYAVGQGVASTIPVIVAGMAGGLPAAAAAGYALNTGDVAKELDDLGVKSPAERARIALMMGVPVAALDVIVPGRVAERLAGRALGRAGTGVAARAARSAASDAATEAVTEAGQEAITHFGSRAATGQPLEPAAGGKRMAEAAIAGGLTGGVIGGVSGAASARQAPEPDARSQALAVAARIRREALAAGKSEPQAMSEAKAAYAEALDALTPPGAWWRPVRKGPEGPESAAEAQEQPKSPPAPPAPAGAAAPTPAPTPAPTAAAPAAKATPKPRPKDMVTLPGGTVGRILRVEASDKPGRATYVIQTEDGRTIRQTEKQLGVMEVTGRPDLEKSLASLRRQLAENPNAADVNRTRRRIATIEAILGAGQPPAKPAAAQPSTTKPKEASSQVVAPSNLEGAREQKKVVRKPQKPAAAPASDVGPAPSERTVLPESPTPASSRTEAPVPRIVLEQMATTDPKKATALQIAIARQNPESKPALIRKGGKYLIEINDPTHVKPAPAATPAQPSARTNAPQATAPAPRAPSAPKPPAAPEVRAARKAAMDAKKAGKSAAEQRAAAREAYNAAKPKDQARAEAEGQAEGAAPPTPDVEARAELLARVETEKPNADAVYDVPAFESDLRKAGWTETKQGKAITWSKGNRSLFIRSQGPNAAAIVQWSVDAGAGVEGGGTASAAPGAPAPAPAPEARAETVLGTPTPGIPIGLPDEAANVRGYKVGELLHVPYVGKSKRASARNQGRMLYTFFDKDGRPMVRVSIRVTKKTTSEWGFPIEHVRRAASNLSGDKVKRYEARIARARRKHGIVAELSGDKLLQMRDDVAAKIAKAQLTNPVPDGFKETVIGEADKIRARHSRALSALREQLAVLEGEIASRESGNSHAEYANIAQPLRDQYLSEGTRIYAETARFINRMFGLHKVHEAHQRAIMRAVSEYAFENPEDANAIVGGYFDILRVVDQLERIQREDMGPDGITLGMVEGPILGVYQDMRGRLDRARAVADKVRTELEGGFGDKDPTPEQQEALKALAAAARAEAEEGRALVKQVDGKIKKAVTAKGRLADALEKVAKWIEDNTDPWGGGPAMNLMGTGTIGQFIGAQIRRNVPTALRKMARRLGRNETEYRITDRHGNVQERGSVIPTEDWWADSATARLMRGALGADIRLHPRMANLIRAYNAGAIADEQFVAQTIARVAGSVEAIRYLAEHGSGAHQAMLALQGLPNRFDPRFKESLEAARKVFDEIIADDIEYAKERGVKPPRYRHKYAPHLKDGDPNTTVAQLFLLLEGKTEAEAATEKLKDMEVRFWQEREGDAHYLLDFNRALRARLSASLRKRRLDILFDSVREYLQSENVLTNRRGERVRAEALKDVLRVLIFREKSRFEEHRDEGMRAVLFNEATKNADEVALADAERVLRLEKGWLNANGYRRVVFVRDSASLKKQSNASWEAIGRSPGGDGAYYASKRTDMPFFTDALPQAKKWLERAIDLNTDKWKRLTGKLRDSEELRRHNGKVQQRVRELYDNPFRASVMMLTQGQSRGLLGYNVGFTTRNVGSGLAAIYSQHGFVPLAMGVARTTRAAGTRLVRNFIVRLGDAGLLTRAQVDRATRFAPVLRDEIYAEAAGINQGEFFELVQRLDDITEGRDERVMRVLRALDPRAMNRVAEGVVRTIAITAADYQITKMGPKGQRAMNQSRPHYRLWEGDRPGADVARADVVRALNDPDSAESHAVNGVMMSQFGYGVWGSEPVFLSRPGWRLLLQYALWPINNEAKFGVRPVTAAARYAKAALGVGRPARNEGVRPRNRWEAWLDAHGAGYTTRKNAGRFMREMAIAGALMGLTDLTGVNVAVFRANLPFLAGMFLLRAMFPDNDTFKRWLQNQLWATGVLTARGVVPIGPAVSAANDIVRGTMSGASKAAKSGNLGDAVPWGATLEVVRRQLIAGDASIKKMLRAHPEEIERMGLSWMFDVFGVQRVQRGLKPGEKAKAVLGLQTAADKNRRVREAR